MAALIETPFFEPEIYQLEEEDFVLGGADGIDNRQAKQLGNRTLWLKEQVEAGQDGLQAHIEGADPHPQYATDEALGNHVAAADPHPVYLTSAEGDAKVAAAVSALVNSSPSTLDTLAELAAALGSDPNFATTITNALALKAPLASAALTGTPSAPTPAQFDTSTKLANMAAVQRALGNLSGGMTVMVSGAIAAADCGKYVAFSSVTDITQDLPLISDVPTGSGFYFKNFNTGVVTLRRSGTNVLAVGANNALTSISLRRGDSIFLISMMGAWSAISSDVALAYSDLFGSFMTTNGWKKYPDPNSPTGYLIEQWGTVTNVAYNATAQTFTFPIVFPNACLNVVSKGFGSVGTTVFCDVNILTFGTAGVTNYQASTNAGTGTVNFRWNAKGY